LKKELILSLIVILFALSACRNFKTPNSDTSGYYTYQTECLGSEYDGSVTVRAWGKGRNRKDAIEQAKKEAVRTILIINMRNSNQPGCDQITPLLNNENQLQTHADFFNNFFKDDGYYLKFISNKDETSKSKERKTSKSEVTYGVIIRVNRSELRKYLIENKVL